MPSTALLTPSHRRDLERCTLLCESVDRHVTGFDTHYLIVNDGDVEAFAHLRGPRRRVLPNRAVLPGWIRAVPLVKWRGRTVFASLRSAPLRGWHIQQLVKFAAVAQFDHDATVVLDSDIAFVRPFDATAACAVPTPIHHHPGGVTTDTVDHALWLATAHRLLGLPAPPLPGDDYIDSVVPWRRDTVRDLLERIEAATGKPWLVALARARTIAEFIIYGVHVKTDDAAMPLHRFTTDSFSRSHWGGEELDAAGVAALVEAMAPHEVAIHVQSWGTTPVELIRSTVGLA